MIKLLVNNNWFPFSCPKISGTFQFSQIKPVPLCILKTDSVASAAWDSTGLHRSTFHCALPEEQKGLEQNPWHFF